MPRIDASRLREMMRRALARRGVSSEHAGWVVEGLVEASLGGIDTHGVRLFSTYLAELDGGRARARPEMRWVEPAASEGGERAARLLDAGGALGVVAGREAAREAVLLARRFGVGSVSVRNSNHFGPASCYTREIARHGCLGLAFTNSDALVAPFGGTRPLFGTNPISLAAPGEGDDLFLADFATSQVSISRVKHYRAEGTPLPTGWAVTPSGQDAADLADPGHDLALLPLGGASGHKGQCLSMMVEILCALLADEPLDHELTHLYAPPYDEPRRVAHLLLAFDLAAFGAPERFARRLSAFLARVRAEEGVGTERVMAPGDPEREATAERTAAGIPLTDAEWARFLEIDGE